MKKSDFLISQELNINPTISILNPFSCLQTEAELRLTASLVVALVQIISDQEIVFFFQLVFGLVHHYFYTSLLKTSQSLKTFARWNEFYFHIKKDKSEGIRMNISRLVLKFHIFNCLWKHYSGEFLSVFTVLWKNLLKSTGCPKKNALLAHLWVSDLGRGVFRGKKIWEQKKYRVV